MIRGILMQLRKIHIATHMFMLTIIVGILCGIGALIFRGLVAFTHNLFFLGRLSFICHETVHTQPSLWGAGVILVPLLGGFFVIWLIETFAKGERGLSVPEVMYKVRNQNGRIKPSIALTKTLASAISIGSGASIGREGPVAQVGAMISSLLGDVININEEQRKFLVVAGVAAGTAAIFNAPLAGTAFAVELFLTSFNILNIILIFLASLIATSIDTYIIGNGSVFSVQATYHFNGYLKLLIHIFSFILLGSILGIISTLFIRGVYWIEDLFVLIFKNPYIRHMTGMLLIGLLLYFFINVFGHYYIEGIGFATIQDCLNLLLTNSWVLLLLGLCKLFATCLSLGTGASGGIISPNLCVGAILGLCFGLIFNYFFPLVAINPALFVISGMAGIMGSVTGALVTAVLLVFEITNNFYSILPSVVTVISSYVVRLQFNRESIYSLKLFRRGIPFRKLYITNWIDKLLGIEKQITDK